MKSLALITVAAAQLMAASSQPRETALDRARDEYVKALLGGDPAAIGLTFAEQAVLVTPGKPEVKGRVAIEEYYGEFLSHAGKVTAFSFPIFEKQISGDLAFAAGSYTQRMALKTGGDVEERGKFVVVLKRFGGEWKTLCLMHASDHPQPELPPQAALPPIVASPLQSVATAVSALLKGNR